MIKFRSIIFLFCLVSIICCNKAVLDKKPLDIISDEAVWNDKALINAYLTQCYSEMYFFANESVGNLWDGDAWLSVWVVGEVSDEAIPQWRDFEDALSKWRYKHGKLTINGGLMEYWGYGTIRKLNEFIERVPASPLDPDIATMRVAEARFLRAFAYFAMVKRYGGVPLITEVQDMTDPEEELYPARNKEDEVYDFIISEMDAIAPDLPETLLASDLGRPSRYAAMALKSRAALYAGSIAQFGEVQLQGIVGIPANKANTYYQAAYDASEAIMLSGKHALYNADADKVTNFKNIFLAEDHSEVIFAKRHDNVNAFAGGNGWNVDFFQCPRPQGWGRGLYDGAYLELAEAFEHVDGTPGTLDRNAVVQGLWTIDELWANKDPRFYATLYTQETSWKGEKLDFHKGLRLPDGTIQTQGSYNGIPANGIQDVDGTCIGFLKYLNEDHDNMFGTNVNWPDSWQDWQIFRYAEILLNYAEAAFELGRPDEALIALNEIRDRAGIAPLDAATRENIRHERRVELAFEGHRYWDLRRWRTAVAELSKWWSGIRYILDVQTGKYQIQIVEKIDGTSNVPQFRPENYYFPITVARTGNNPNLVENPGY